ncbi:MAG: hypothetical protein Q7K55_04750 [Candidatus Levybacteria bacterium]|nr:hypothetical protein [Candidatus Levybacteria bacterium]
MNNKLSFEQSTFRILYLKYKELIIPGGIIFVSIILFLQVVLPQFQELSLIRNKEEETKERIRNLNNNLMFLSKLNNSSLDFQLKLTTSVLPIEKDFVGIINAVSNTAVDTGVALDDFGFVVGELSTRSAAIKTSGIIKDKPSIDLGLSVRTNIDGLKRFIERLSEEFPLSQIMGISIDKKKYGISTVFFYRALVPDRFNESTELKPFSKADEAMLNKLSSWNEKNSKGIDFLMGGPSISNSEPSGTDSANLENQ